MTTRHSNSQYKVKMKNKETIINAKSVLLPNGWGEDIFIKIDKEGRISEVSSKSITSNKFEIQKVDLLLPAVANLHSHSFQRAMAGLTESRGYKGNDSFWTWRDLMYKFLNHLTPEDILSITAFGQMEMLESGYASVGEFHYLHHQKNGSQYENISEMSQSIIESSEETGIGLCLLPVLYERGGCDNRPLSFGQLRFGNNVEQYTKLIHDIQKRIQHNSNFNLGVAAHSLRAVKEESLKSIASVLKGPIHIHVAEQEQEVSEVLSSYGQRPVEWLLNNMEVNERWSLIHCTQMTKEETQRLSISGAVAGLCPVTEANLGDGIFNGIDYINLSGKFGVGTDSNINISLIEELKMLEYSQRLRQKQRAVLSDLNRSTGRVLFEKSVQGGALSTQRETGEISPGKWADLISLDISNINLNGTYRDTTIDSWIFASNRNSIKEVWSAGSKIVQNGEHLSHQKITDRYRKTLSSLRNRI